MFYNNTEIKYTVVKINLGENANIIQQKGKPIQIYVRDHVAEELKRLTKKGYLERSTEITEDCFVSPAVITVNNKSIKIALDSRKLNEATIKRNAQLPNMEELISRISQKLSEETESEITITKLEFDYASGQLKLHKISKTNKKFVHIHDHRRRIYRILPFPERILRTGRHTNHLSGTDRQNT